MKKVIKWLPLLALPLGLCCGFLRKTLFAAADHRGLLPTDHPAAVTVTVLSIVMAVCFLLYLWLGKKQDYRFLTSLPIGAIGSVAAAGGLLFWCFAEPDTGKLVMVLKLGAALCFFVARGLGRDVVEKFAGKGALASVEGYFEKYGTKTILVCRLLPFVSFDAVSYFAGLTPMKFIPFFIATGIGQTPATIVYSYVGGMLTGGAKALMIGLLCLFSLVILAGIIKQIYTDRQAKKAAKSHE